MENNKEKAYWAISYYGNNLILRSYFSMKDVTELALTKSSSYFRSIDVFGNCILVRNFQEH